MKRRLIAALASVRGRLSRSAAALSRMPTAVIVVIVVFVGGVVILNDYLQAYGECRDENKQCAVAGPSRLWLGRVFTRDGAPAANATVRYYFDSVAAPFPNWRPVTIVTDREGRYCIRWPQDAAFASAVARAAGGAPDSRYVAAARKARGPLIVSPGTSEQPAWDNTFYTGAVTGGGWRAAADATTHCPSASPPWYRFNNLTGNWHYLLLLLAPLAGIAIALVGAALRWEREPSANAMVLISLGTAAASAILFALVWGTHSI